MATRLSSMTTSGAWARMALCCLVATCAASCGDSDTDDVVYISVFNGYPGDNQLTVYGPDGKIAENLTFGERSEPVLVRREQFNEFLVTLSSMPNQASVTPELYSMYPKEIATLFVNRRAGTSDVNVFLQRHHQVSNGAVQEDSRGFPCVVEFFNGMSMTSDNARGRDQLMQQWSFDASERLFMYDPSQESVVQTECGPLDLNDARLGGLGQQFIQQRSAALAPLDNDPWYYMVDPLNPEDGDFTFRWGRTTSLENGNISGPLGTREYLECLQGVVSIEPEMTVDPTAPVTTTGEDTCDRTPQGAPTIPLRSDGNLAVRLDQLAFIECIRPQDYTARTVQAGGDESLLVGYDPAFWQGTSCNRNVRLRTPGVDSVFDDVPRTGPLVSLTLAPLSYTWHYVTFYGRPVNPFVEQLTADSLYGSVDGVVTDFTYPGDTPAPNGPRAVDTNPGG